MAKRKKISKKKKLRKGKTKKITRRRRKNPDEQVRDLARLAGTGNLAAAKKLVRALERTGAQDSEQELAALAQKTLQIYQQTHQSQDLDDLQQSADQGNELARAVLQFLGRPEEQFSACLACGSEMTFNICTNEDCRNYRPRNWTASLTEPDDPD